MDQDRRKFLKIAGATAIAGIGVPAVAKLSSATSAMASTEQGEAAAGHGEAGAHGAEGQSGSGVRYGMVIDMRKFYGRPDLLDKAIDKSLATLRADTPSQADCKAAMDALLKTFNTLEGK